MDTTNHVAPLPLGRVIPLLPDHRVRVRVAPPRNHPARVIALREEAEDSNRECWLEETRERYRLMREHQGPREADPCENWPEWHNRRRMTLGDSILTVLGIGALLAFGMVL